jgi:hypothetical protein
MNERIKQLQFQAAASVSPLKEGSEWQREFTEKYVDYEASTVLKQHFGIKE